MKFVNLILKNLTRSKRRTILTTFSIAVSLFVFSLLSCLPSVANEFFKNEASARRLVCHHRAGNTYMLPEAYKQRILSTPHVESVSALTFFGGIYSEVTDQFPNFGLDSDDFGNVWPDWVPAKAFQEMKKLRTGCLVTRGTMEHFHWHVGQQIMLRGTIYPVNLTLQIVGQLTEKAPPKAVVFRRDYLDEATGNRGLVSSFWIRTDSVEAMPRVMAALDESFANSENETQTEMEAAFIADTASGLQSIFTLAKVFSGIVLLTLAMVAINTASMSVRQRRAEIAMLRAIGFSIGLILSCLVAESAALGIIGGAIGCGASYLALRVVSFSPAVLGLFGVLRMPALVAAESIAAAATIGIVSGLLPSISAARRNIVDALRLVA